MTPADYALARAYWNLLEAMKCLTEADQILDHKDSESIPNRDALAIRISQHRAAIAADAAKLHDELDRRVS